MNNTCLKNCPDGTYKLTTGNTISCPSCSANCKTCSAGADLCLTCYSNYTLSTLSCVVYSVNIETITEGISIIIYIIMIVALPLIIALIALCCKAFYHS